MDLREAAQQALEALGSAGWVFKGEHDTCGGCPWCDAPSYGPCEPHCEKDRAVKALRSALAEDVTQRPSDEQQMIERGTKAWADVPNATDWVEEMRGNKPTATSNGMPAVEGPLSKAHRARQESRQVEPVAYVTGYSKGYATVQPVDPCLLMCVGMALYRSPPKREPLTESFLEELAEKHVTNCYFDTLTYAREIERLHEIGGEE